MELDVPSVEYPPQTGLLRASLIQLLLAVSLLATMLIEPKCMPLTLSMFLVGVSGLYARASGNLRLVAALLNALVLFLWSMLLISLFTDPPRAANPVGIGFFVVAAALAIGTCAFNAVALIRTRL